MTSPKYSKGAGHPTRDTNGKAMTLQSRTKKRRLRIVYAAQPRASGESRLVGRREHRKLGGICGSLEGCTCSNAILLIVGQFHGKLLQILTHIFEERVASKMENVRVHETTHENAALVLAWS